MDQVDELLATHSPDVVAVFQKLRQLVHRSLPGITEKVYPGWHALGFRDADAGYLCGLFPFDDHVRFLFEHGARLPDPAGVLEGTDRKQVRWINVRPGTEYSEAVIHELLLEALHHGRTRPAALIKPKRSRTPRSSDR